MSERTKEDSADRGSRAPRSVADTKEKENKQENKVEGVAEIVNKLANAHELPQWALIDDTQEGWNPDRFELRGRPPPPTKIAKGDLGDGLGRRFKREYVVVSYHIRCTCRTSTGRELDRTLLAEALRANALRTDLVGSVLVSFDGVVGVIYAETMDPILDHLEVLKEHPHLNPPSLETFRSRTGSWDSRPPAFMVRVQVRGLKHRCGVLEGIISEDVTGRGSDKLRVYGSLWQALLPMLVTQCTWLLVGFAGGDAPAGEGYPPAFSDGLAGAAVLARALRMQGRRVVVITDPACEKAVRFILEDLDCEIWINDLADEELLPDELRLDAQRKAAGKPMQIDAQILSEVKRVPGPPPDLIISMARPGWSKKSDYARIGHQYFTPDPNSDGGVYDCGSIATRSCMEKLLVHRSPLELNNGHPAIFIAIGSLGNELGMGNVAPQVQEHMPLGDLLCTPVCSFVERFDRRGTEPFDLFRSEFGQNA